MANILLMAPNLSQLLAFAAVAFVIIVVPGPSVLFVISRGVAYGRGVALLTVAGNEAGLLLQVLAVALGLVNMEGPAQSHTRS